MAARQLQIVLRHLRRLAGTAGSSGVTDGQLLERFVTQHDEAAFELLVRRHERMVWGVCRRLLANPHDTEDAFQATFVVLVRKAATVAQRESVACWLHQVAYRVALRACANRARVAAHEQLGMDLMSAADPHDGRAEGDWSDLRPLLDQEIDRLPEKYRAPVVLCYLEGKSYEEAAQQLGCPKGTLSIRLTRARELLRVRLARRGLTLTSAVLATAIIQQAISGPAPAALIASTLQSVALLAVQGASSAPGVSVQVATLADGLLRAMFLSQAKLVLTGLLTLTVLTLGAGVAAHQVWATKEKAKGQGEQYLAGPRTVEPKAAEKAGTRGWLRRPVARGGRCSHRHHPAVATAPGRRSSPSHRMVTGWPTETKTASSTFARPQTASPCSTFRSTRSVSIRSPN